MIKAIIFDAGGVIVPEKRLSEGESLIERVGISKNKLEEIQLNLYPLVIKGEMSLYDYYRCILNKSNMKSDPREFLQRHLADHRKVLGSLDIKIVDLIENLRGKYLVCWSSNTELEIAQETLTNIFFSNFSKRYLSCEIGLSKPEREYFEYILNDLKIPPEQILFIDDRRENIDGAESCGFRTVHYS